MQQPRIAVYTMAKNEAKHVEQFVKTTQEADVVVVTDTGSTDGTPDLLKDAGVQVHSARIMPWRFDVATNCALSNVPEDVDICVKLDLDEVIVGDGWREELTKFWRDDVAQVRYWYTHAWHVSGKVPSNKFYANNVHTRANFVWRYPGHAALYATTQVKVATAEVFEIHHYQDSAKKRPDYIPLLELGVYEARCPRTLMYLGREYATTRQWQKAINTLLDYLEHPDATWVVERAIAMCVIANCYEALGAYDLALSWFFQAHGDRPNNKDLWWDTLRFFHARGDFTGGYWAGHRCLSITERDPYWLGTSRDAWFELPYVLTARCAWHMDRKDEARQLVRKALELNPESHAARDFSITVGI